MTLLSIAYESVYQLLCDTLPHMERVCCVDTVAFSSLMSNPSFEAFGQAGRKQCKG